MNDHRGREAMTLTHDEEDQAAADAHRWQALWSRAATVFAWRAVHALAGPRVVPTPPRSFAPASIRLRRFVLLQLRRDARSFALRSSRRARAAEARARDAAARCPHCTAGWVN